MNTTSAGRLSITAQLMRHAQHRAHSVALQSTQSQLSYAELASAAIGFALYLEQNGESKCSIALCVSDPVILTCAFLGARLCGHNVLVLNPDWPAELQSQCLDHLQPSQSFDDRSITQIIAKQTKNHTDNIANFDNPRWCDTDLDAPFYTGFTSGSEGAPKGFTRHENSWLHSFESDNDSYRLTSADTVVCPGKLAHSLFLYATLRSLYAGLRVVFFAGLEQSQQRQAVSAIKSAVLFAVPAQLQSLSDCKIQFPQLRLVISAGAKLQPTLRNALEQTLPAAEIMECYGSSELSYIALSQPAHSPPAASVGRPCAGVQVRVLDSDNKPVAPTNSGRLLVNSPMRFIGYAEPNNRTSLKNMQENEGFLDTGDTGYLDERGFLFITGRSDRMMNVAGHSVFPEQIESALAACEGIKRVAVFPVADKLRGQRPVAVIQSRSQDNISRSDIMAFAKQSLPEHAIPRLYYSIGSWPFTVSDKTDIQKIKALYQQQLLEPLL